MKEIKHSVAKKKNNCIFLPDEAHNQQLRLPKWSGCWLPGGPVFCSCTTKCVFSFFRLGWWRHLKPGPKRICDRLFSRVFTSHIFCIGDLWSKSAHFILSVISSHTCVRHISVSKGLFVSTKQSIAFRDFQKVPLQSLCHHPYMVVPSCFRGRDSEGSLCFG